MSISILLQSNPQNDPIALVFRHLAPQYGFTITPHAQADNAMWIYLGHWQDSQADFLNREAIQHVTPLLILDIQSNLYQMGPLVIPYETPCLVCWDLQQAVFSSLGHAISTQHTTTDNATDCVQPILEALHAYLQNKISPIRPGGIAQFSRPNGLLVRQFRMVKSPTCPICSSLRTHSAESYRSYLVL